MSDEETSEITNTGEQKLEGDIEREISKLEYFLEETDDVIEAKNYSEMEAINNRAGKIIEKISELISQTEELKIDNSKTAHSVRQWKKDTKSKYSALIEVREKIVQQLKKKQEEDGETELQRLESQDKQLRQEELRRDRLREAQEERRRARLREAQEERERQFWQEKHEAELRMTQRKIEMEKTARCSTAKLPKLKITLFNGTATDWVRFENMFTTLVHERATTAEEKYGFLLEMVSPKVRDKIANLKPGEAGYRIAWERLRSEYGHPKHVINAHMDAIINLSPVRGHNYEKVQEFYEKLSKNFDALQTLGESESLSGFVMTTINKLPQIKPDLVRADDDWEEWTMEVLLKNLQKWLQRNKVDDGSNQRETRYKKPEGHWYQKSSGPTKPRCVFCGNNEHWSDQCKTVKRLVDRKKFFAEKNLCFNRGRTGHRGNQCQSRGCRKCNAKHHTSLCDKKEDEQQNKAVLSMIN
jgi:chemotaxis protein histidine kinase CheA